MLRTSVTRNCLIGTTLTESRFCLSPLNHKLRRYATTTNKLVPESSPAISKFPGSKEVPTAADINLDDLPKKYNENSDISKLLHDHHVITLADLKGPDDHEMRRSVTEGGWAHPVYTAEQMQEVGVEHRPPKSISDKVALYTLRFIRSSFDLVTGYKHPPPGHEDDPKYAMTTAKWLQRFVFLESIAGVPGMVGGMVRHLHSLRLMRRDRAWIETLLEEAYNERMHLLTFIQLYKPGVLMRLLLLGAQGVFFNVFFVAYLLWPRVCHRFVGYLEEEAIVTYRRCLRDLDHGLCPEWKTEPAPQIAKHYWAMPDDATVADTIWYVMSDESRHREVNHTLANIKSSDRNPYKVRREIGSIPQPMKDLTNYKIRPTGWERDEIAA